MSHRKPGLTRLIASVLGGSLCVAAASAVQAADPANGKKLYEERCMQCHDTSIHTRPDKIIFSKAAIRNRVAFCEKMAGSNWSKEQMDDVAEYLNQEFYHYDDK